eukprot:CAMPEP_0201658162 /NCGR_PEP_ID=MMETSP0494-20130426/1158_1 /ASSEMBLY_ACC=CAM_ASM_000839 /TAXON_ID=420259 /ORGANISM="Thalassiosira gravida, Strain GMp14c1" /LENGTH=448 /DNA_ID=CAMNT_0048135125 /DNA_START=140 /DNA_END=1486 /DNA_ORIENTATION=-
MKTSPAATQKGGRKSASLPPETVEYLKSWMMSPEHVAHPYPTEQEKAQIMAETGIELKQLTNWFVNNRKRFWKPRVEAKLQKFPPPGGVGAASGSHATLPGGGLSISIHHMNPKPQGATSFPMLPNNASSVSAAAPLYAQAAQGGGPASPHNQPNNFGPAGVIAPVNGAPHRDDDPHTISEGSGSSACNSDDDSVAASSCVHTTFGAASAQYLDSHLSTVNTSTVRTTGATSLMPGGGYRRHEEVDVHVLHPEGSIDSELDALPSLRDLTIKSSVPKERILATFKCPISYTIPYDIEHDRKKVQSRRDGEVLRVKKHYLKLYLATRGIHSASSPLGNTDVPSSSASSVSSVPEFSAATPTTTAVSPIITTTDATPNSPSRTRAFTCTDIDQDKGDSNPSPRKRARTQSGILLSGEDEWRNRCQNAKSLFCTSLPGMEEAARMFGYVSQ